MTGYNGTMRNICIILSITTSLNLSSSFEVPTISSRYNVPTVGGNVMVIGRHHGSQRSSSFTNSFRISSSKFRISSAHSQSDRKHARTNLSMHLGHSHSHHHHHTHDHSHNHSHDHSHNHNEIKKPTTIRGKILYQISKRGKVISILFAAAATLLPALLFKKRPVNKTDIVLFAATSTLLSFADTVRSETKYIINKVQGLRDGFLKHRPKKMNATKYLFQNNNAADRVTFVGAAVNLILSLGKGIVGIMCHSSALVADAGHSLSDLFSDFITLWAVQIGRLPPDDDHPYGHGKFEAIGSLFLALTLFATGLSVGASSNAKLINIINAAPGSAPVIPTFPALIMAFLSIVSKEWLYRITKRVGEEINSQVVIANAWHHRSDAYSSILSMASIGLAMSIPGMAFADASAGLLVAGMICMTGAEIMGEAVKQLTDTSDKELEDRIKKIALESYSDVIEVKRIRARWMGSSALVDVEVTTSDHLSSSANRAVQEMLRVKIMDNEPGVLDADVHATTNALTCPLLTATKVHEDTKSVQELEDDARSILSKHDDVQSVRGCTIHYDDTLLATINANIKLKNADITIEKAENVAVELKDLLERSDNIHSAGIFLDLNTVPVVSQ